MIGALQAGWDEVVGIEIERDYVEIAQARLCHWVGIDTSMDTAADDFSGLPLFGGAQA
jgi:hypothetical protein